MSSVSTATFVSVPPTSQAPRPRIELVYLSPELAATLLANPHPLQRPINLRKAESICDDIGNGRWRLTHQGIAVNSQGQVLDGRTRLTAIVRAGRTVPIYIHWDAPDETMPFIDIGVTRSVPQTAKAMGLEGVSNALAAIARAVELGFAGESGRRGRLSHQRQIEAVLKHREAIEFVLQHLSTRRRHFGRAAVVAPLVRAFYSQDRQRLAEFCRVLSTNEVVNPLRDLAAAKLHSWLVNPSYGVGPRRLPSNHSVYRKVSRALRAFLDGEPVRSLHEAREELFPLPGEELTLTQKG
jgi:hypothetical protein